jgi:hypothetical protein
MNARKQTPLTRGTLNLDDKFAVKHWTTEWGVTIEQLQQAIEKVGPSIHAIAKELGQSDELEGEHCPTNDET